MVVLQIIALWLASTAVGAAAFPLVFSVCPRLKDRGWAVSRIVGLVLTAFPAWILSHARILPYGTVSVILSLVILGGVSWLMSRGRGKELAAFLQEKKNLLLTIEGIFLLFFLLFLLFVALNPNIDPDSERFMDYALLNGIEKTAYFPPSTPGWRGRR